MIFNKLYLMNGVLTKITTFLFLLQNNNVTQIPNLSIWRVCLPNCVVVDSSFGGF